MSKAFKETQKFSQWWLWLILLFIGALPILGIYKQLIIGEKFGDKPISDLGLIIFAVFVFSLIAMFWFVQLKTEIDQNEIRMRFFPLVKKRVSWEEIKNAEIVITGPTSMLIESTIFHKKILLLGKYFTSEILTFASAQYAEII